MDIETAAVIANRGIRCGNHGTAKVYHASVTEVKVCFAPPRKARGWWSLPIAASMWSADGADLRA